MKAFVDDKTNVTGNLKLVLRKAENIEGKGENAGYKAENNMGKGENATYQHFLIFQQCYRKAYFPGSFKVRIVWRRVNSLPNDNFLTTKFKAFAGDKLNVVRILRLLLLIG